MSFFVTEDTAKRVQRRDEVYILARTDLRHA
jgi:hypothetical protein